MKLQIITAAVTVIAHFATSTAFGCDRGGYRAPVRAYSAPRYYGLPVHRRVVRRPVQPVSVTHPASTRSFPQPFPQAAPQIRLAPTQRAGRQLSAPAQAPNTAPTVPQVARQPAQAQPQRSPSQPTQSKLSALDFLAGTSTPTEISRAPAAQSQPNSGHVGTWQAKTPNNAIVTLTLNADGSFRWAADNNGKISQFNGNFTVADGKLTLSRSSDNQKLAGQFVLSDNRFNFRLDGAKDTGLDFSRQS